MAEQRVERNEEVVWFTMRFNNETKEYRTLRLKKTTDGAIMFEVQYGVKGQPANFIRFKMADHELAELAIKLLKVLIK